MEWRLCPDFPDYEVSEYGDVRRAVSTKNWLEGKVLSPYMQDGYKKYSLMKEGRQYNVYAHRLVATAFIGPKPFEKAEVCHWDGSRTNNHVSNLRWDSHSANILDAVRHGTICGNPERSPAKLNREKVREIRGLIANGERYGQIAAKYQVKPESIRRIACGLVWVGVV